MSMVIKSGIQTNAHARYVLNAQPYIDCDNYGFQCESTVSIDKMLAKFLIAFQRSLWARYTFIVRLRAFATISECSHLTRQDAKLKFKRFNS